MLKKTKQKQIDNNLPILCVNSKLLFHFIQYYVHNWYKNK